MTAIGVNERSGPASPGGSEDGGDPERLIELSGVSASYVPGMPVLEDVSLTVNRGEFACVVGPSGCGKSTLLSILSGLRAPEEGTVQIAGRDVYAPGREAASLPRLGYVFQEPRLLPWRSVRQNIELAMRGAEIPRSEHDERIRRYLDLLHIGELVDAWPLRISGGQRQRVAIGRALSIDPLYILMDEPFSALDELTARALRAELLELWQHSKKTILFVTHSIREAVYLADRIFVLTTNPGRMFRVVDIDVPRPRQVDDARLIELEADILGTALTEWERAQSNANGSQDQS